MKIYGPLTFDPAGSPQIQNLHIEEFADLAAAGAATAGDTGRLIFTADTGTVYVGVNSTWVPFVIGNTTEVFAQNVPASVWSITHNLNKHPSITVVDSSGTVCVGDYQYIDDTHITLAFSSPFSGVCYLN